MVFLASLYSRNNSYVTALAVRTFILRGSNSVARSKLRTASCQRPLFDQSARLFKNSCVIWQGACGNGQFVASSIIIEVAKVKVQRQSQVRVG